MTNILPHRFDVLNISMADRLAVKSILVIQAKYIGDVMLGVRRPGVTIALQTLEGKGLIRSNRGEVVILDRTSLVALAEGSYGRAEAEYDRLIDHLH